MKKSKKEAPKPNIVLDPNDPMSNEKQIKFFVTVINAINAALKNDDIVDALRYFWYGGAIRGGKTFICLFILIYLSMRFPGSRWYVIRKAFPDLRRTAIPSLQKLLKNSKNVRRWNKSSSDYFVEFKNGSRIYMFAENYQNDKDLDRFKGLECNGFLLEQVEELQEETEQKCIERSGSWYDVDGEMPPPLIFSTFNPTYNWVKTKIYEAHKAGLLKPPYFFLEASPKDNKFVTKAQWQAWSDLDEEFYSRFIDGDWSIKIEGTFYSAFSEAKHVGERAAFKPDFPVWISFDFNVDPMCCTVFQTDHSTFFHIFMEFRIEDSDTYEICEKIMEFFAGNDVQIYVTGDASGRARMAGTRMHVNHYQIISGELMIGPPQIKVPTANPLIAESRTFVNSLMKADWFDFCIHPSLEWTFKDLMFTEKDTDENGKLCIKKKDINKYLNIDNKKLSHLADTVRYGMHTTCGKLISIPRS